MRITNDQFLKRIVSSSLAKASGIYTISSFIYAAIPFLLLPVLTRRLSPTDYGIVSMFQLTVSIVLPFVGLNLEGAVARKYYEKDNSDFASYIGTSLLLALGSLVIVSTVFWFGFDKIQQVTQIPATWLKFVLVVVVGQFIVNVVLTVFQVRVQPVKYGILQITQAIVNIGLTLFFVVLLNKTWSGRLEALIITAVIMSFAGIIILKNLNLIRFRIKKIDVKYALSFGVPLIPHALGGVMFSAIDRLFLTNMIGLDQTGNYTVAYQIGAVISIFTVAFNNAYVPWLFDKLNKDDFEIKRKIVRFTYLYFAVLLVAALILILVFPLIVSLFIGKAYRSTDIYSTFIVLGFVCQGMYFMVTNYILYVKKTYLQGLVTVSAGIFKIPVTYVLILVFGAAGAAISYFITFFIFFVVTWKVSSKVYKMPWNLTRIQ